MELIKNEYGMGIMAKTVKLQIFLEPKTYLEVLEEAKHHNIRFKNDSELIRKILFKFFEDMPMLSLQIDQLKKGIAKRDVILRELEEKANAKRKPKKEK